MIDLSDKKTLRIITYIVLIYSILQILNYMISFLRSYFNLTRSTLIPDSLIDYVAFPLFFILPIFIGIAVFALRSLLNNKFDKRVIIISLAIVILYFIFGSTIYGLIMDHNPYRN